MVRHLLRSSSSPFKSGSLISLPLRDFQKTIHSRQGHFQVGSENRCAFLKNQACVRKSRSRSKVRSAYA
ncbi:MAG: hypothetical protein RLZZ244_3067 [Verrucomicrobiota bacterium]|jgi:hypothetical protein